MTSLEFSYQVASLRNTLHAFTRRFTNNHDESLDLVQDTMMKALMYRDKFRHDVNLKGWLFTIMRNTFINNYRKHQRARTSTDNTKELFQLNVKDGHTFANPDSTFEYQDLWKNVDALAEELRTPLKMHVSGYKYHEIAEHLGIPIGTVKNRIFHARKELQERLTGY